VYGRTYAEIVQDMVDFFAWGQVDSGFGRGGWRYAANYSESDMSTVQWPPLGMLAAEENMGSTVPSFVRDELELYLNVAQNTALNSDHGGFAYYTPTSTTYYNITKAAAGIIAHEFLGTPLDDSKVQSALGFINRHWNDTGTGWHYTKLFGNSYGMYGLMKAMRIPEPDITTIAEYDYVAGEQTASSFDWYYWPDGQSQQGMAYYSVTTQQADGSWDDTVGSNKVHNAFATGWQVLTLLQGVSILPPEAEICDCDKQDYDFGQDIQLDASCSYHPDITRHIVSYEWDLDNDGEFDDATGQFATIIGGFSVEGHYPVSLRVTDDNPDYMGGPQTSIYTCQVYVHPPPHCPHAFAGGPYIGWINEAVTLDATASWDPDNPPIASYEWDLDNDGLFGTEDNDCFGEPSDAVGATPEWIWYTPYYGAIGLKVTDAASVIADPCSDVDYTTIEIGNHAPVSDPNGPYGATPGSCITLDGSASYDPDPGDSITLDWDLDNDGNFDDCSDVTCEFCVGPDIGTVYDLCLKVTDSLSEYDIKCTTVKIQAARAFKPIKARGIILTRNEQEDRDQAQFKLDGVTGISAGFCDQDGDFIVEFGPEFGPLIYTYTGGNIPQDMDCHCNRAEECVINIRNVDFDNTALDNLLPNSMTVTLEVNGTKYGNTGAWGQYDSGSGTWTKYRKDI
ncbi:MAG: hypothetical protein D3923_03550, partial [Candidatus Electrothrix sp. AR3]|nr:hypothetical protein [Candidatus Electrothrix sp. AR3]